MSLSFEARLPICEVPKDLPLQQQEELQSVLADLLLTMAINSRELHNGGDDVQ
jgi:hypothetical protein